MGTTNRTHLSDFQEAIGPETALLLRVHSSNFKQIGFTAEVSLADMVALAHERRVARGGRPGQRHALDTARYGLAAEPTVQDSVAAGADLVTFSGDKLLGGPQAGLIVGRADLIAELRQHPLTRALRVDKSTLAALQATLLHYVRGEAEREVPVWRMIATPLEELAARAADLAAGLRAAGIPATVVQATSTVGGGALPGETLPTWAIGGGGHLSRCAGRRAAPRRSAGGRPDRGRTTAPRPPHRAAGSRWHPAACADQTRRQKRNRSTMTQRNSVSHHAEPVPSSESLRLCPQRESVCPTTLCYRAA